MAKQTISSGENGVQYDGKLNSNFNELYPISDALVLRHSRVFNILDYGAVGNNSTDNTTAIQNCINAAAISGGTVYIPSGIYKTHTITIGPRDAGFFFSINILGDGMSSVLKSISAETLINYTDYPTYQRKFSNFVIDNDGVGTVGLCLDSCSYFTLEEILFKNFPGIALKFIGALIGSVNSCRWQSWSVYADAICVNTEPKMNGESVLYANHLVEFKNCVFNSGKKWAINSNSGEMMKFDHCDFEWNGTNLDLTTGIINYTCIDNGPWDYSSAQGLCLDTCWFENNSGSIVINDVGSSGRKLRSTIRFCNFYSNTSTYYNVIIIGILGLNYLLLDGNNFSDYKGLSADGANCKVIGIHNNINPATLSLTNGATFKQIINLTGDLTPYQYTGALTDNTPTAAEINSVTGLTPATAGAGFQCTIKDSNGSGLLYKIESDGTSWGYTKLTAAV
jgi:hypothetical protein